MARRQRQRGRNTGATCPTSQGVRFELFVIMILSAGLVS
jgi:hypothetical protein